MPNAGGVLRDAAITACQTTPVATAAGMALGVWADPSAPHVFAGLAGYLGGRNRGRLPFVEVAVTGQDYAPVVSVGDGDLTQTLTLRCHVGGRTLAQAEDLSEAILAACLVAIRGLDLSFYGGDRISGLDAGPWGHMREATLTVSQNFHRDTYEAT